MIQLMGFIYDISAGELVWRDPVAALPAVPLELHEVPPQEYIIFVEGDEKEAFTAGTVQRLIDVMQKFGQLRDSEEVRELERAGLLDPQYANMLAANRWLKPRLDLTVI